MAERSWFFNAEQTGEDEYDRVYLAEDFAKYFSLFISNGVFPNPSTGLQVLAQEVPNMTVTLKPGFAFINGYGYENTSDYKFTIDTADGVLNREDSIFIRWYLTDRKIAAYKAVGTPGAEASHVDLIRTEDYWDLCVARITVEAGVTSITQSAITDTRLNTDLCGIVATLVDQVDTTTLYNQIQADLEEFQNVSEEDFTEWYNQQQQMFTTWYQKQQSDFDEWFDDINAKLGTEPATALQQQIDEINTSIEENSDRMFSTYHHVKNGTMHTFIGSGSNGKVKMTADVESGDTVNISWMPQQEMTIEGETSQPGTGDPSPNNIRMIDGVGMYDQCVVLDGSSDETYTTSGTSISGVYRIACTKFHTSIIRPSAANEVGKILSSVYPAKTADNTYNRATGISVEVNGTLTFFDPDIQSVSAFRTYLSAHPLIVWYRSVDFYKSKGPFYYVHEVSDGTTSPYKAIGIELNAPLFDGDSLEIGGLSGFDQMVVLDENTDFYMLTATDGSYSRITCNLYSSDIEKSVDYYSRIASSLYPTKSPGGTYRKEMGIAADDSGLIIIYDPKFTTVEAFKDYLAAHPLIIWYRSVDYTEENDIAVALEKRVNGYAALDGKENWLWNPSPGWAYRSQAYTDHKDSTAIQSSHYVGVDAQVPTAGQTAINTAGSLIVYDTDWNSASDATAYFNSQYSAGTPVQVVYELASSATYAHPIQPETLPAYYGFEEFVDAIAGEDVTGRWLTFTNDGEQLNFKGGGALSKSKLDLATAEPGDVRQGMTFYAKGKELKTGVVPSFDYNVDAKGTEHYQNKLRILFDPGFYGRYGQAVPDPGVTFDAGDAGVGDVLEGKTFSSNGPGAKATGQMPERGTWNGTYSGSDVVIPEGHHSGGGSVSVAGGNRGNWGTTINQGGSVTIPQGYHSGGGVVRANSVTPGCERAGACWANGMANGSGWQGSAYCNGGNNLHDAWVNAAVSGYFCVWTMDGGGGQAPANYWFGWANAGQQLGARGPGSSSTGCVMVTYIHI